MKESFDGIDVSEYQGIIDWEKVKSDGIQFAMLRCGYGRFESQKDTRFEQNYAGAKAAGIPVGAYLFSYAVNDDMALMEAENCLSLIKGKRFEFPVVYDVETPAQAKLGKDKLTQMVDVFCRRVEAAGYYVSIYASLSFISNYFDMEKLKRYDIWLAQWSKEQSYTEGVGMWQYSPTGSVDGISGFVDLNKAYKNYTKIITSAGLNGYPKNSDESADSIAAGSAVRLSNTPLYSLSKAKNPSVYVNGTYYIYDGKLINGKYRITDKASNTGKKPLLFYVTGWIDGSVVKK